MKVSSHSYEFDSQEVLDVCMWYVNVREVRVDREREEMIERLITKPKKWWQFWRTKHTRESAIEYLKTMATCFVLSGRNQKHVGVIGTIFVMTYFGLCVMIKLTV